MSTARESEDGRCQSLRRALLRESVGRIMTTYPSSSQDRVDDTIWHTGGWMWEANSKRPNYPVDKKFRILKLSKVASADGLGESAARTVSWCLSFSLCLSVCRVKKNRFSTVLILPLDISEEQEKRGTPPLRGSTKNLVTFNISRPAPALPLLLGYQIWREYLPAVFCCCRNSTGFVRVQKNPDGKLRSFSLGAPDIPVDPCQELCIRGRSDSKS